MAAALPEGGLPRWAANGVLPLVNLVAAFVVAGIVILIIGESPIRALAVLVRGAFGFPEAWGYTLYYATNFIFTALAVSVALHCGLFNIGGEGQGYLGGLGVGLVCLVPRWLVAAGRRPAPAQQYWPPARCSVRPVGVHPGLPPGEARLVTSSSRPSCSTSSPRPR